jgi:hypothetical protein
MYIHASIYMLYIGRVQTVEIWANKYYCLVGNYYFFPASARCVEGCWKQILD